MTDREISLIKSAQGGDTRAFGELVENYDSQVMNLALSVVGSSNDAMDIYQEIFIKVFKSLKGFRFRSEFKTWLYKVTMNTCFTYIKKRQRERERTGVSIDENPHVILNLPADGSTGADRPVMDDEISQVLRGAVDELPPKQKAVVILRHYEDRKIREIAEIMSLGEGTVKSYLFRAVQTLKKKVGPYYQLGEAANGV